MVDVDSFDQRYEVLNELGRGNYGVTHLIRERETQLLWAGKFMERGPRINVDVEREVLNHRLLAHPYIIRFKEVMLTHSHLVVIMEYASQGELFHYVQTQGRLSEMYARFFFKQLITAVEFCHDSGIYHRDLKLENALIDVVENVPYIKLCDFGFSKHAVQDSSLKSAKGTVEYLAPEVVLCSYSNKYEGRPSDTWACGVMLFLMLVGGYPYEDTEGQPHSAVRNIVRGHYELPAHVSLSANCLHLIQQIFTVNPTQRITIDQIKQHPWYQESMPDALQEAQLQFHVAQAAQPVQHEQAVREVLTAARLV